MNLVLIALSSLALLGCSNQDGLHETLKQDAKAMQPEQVLRENFRATQAEDIEAVLKTIDPKSPHRESMRNSMAMLFSLYDLDYELEALEPLEINGHTAKFRIVLVTRKRSGPDFRDNRVTYTQLLVKNNDEWHLSDTLHVNVEFI